MKQNEIICLQERVHQIIPSFEVCESDLANTGSKLAMLLRCTEACAVAQLSSLAELCLECLDTDQDACNQSQVSIIIKSMHGNAALQDSLNLVKSARHHLKEVDVKKILAESLEANKELHVQLVLEFKLADDFHHISEVS